MRGTSGVKTLLRGPHQASRRLARRAMLPVYRRRPRRLDICCCGLSKTGTHSMAGLFENYRSEHHPDAELRLRLATAYLNGETDAAAARQVLQQRDRTLWLEMESSTLAGILIEPFGEACPGKRFILTIRDVYSWCDSWLDHNINWPPDDSSPWAVLDRRRLRVGDFLPTTFDAPLTERGFPPLACFFQLWAGHNERVLAALPPDRLLVVRTDEITERIPEIAAWAGVPVERLRLDRKWLFSTPERHRVLSTLDGAFVQETAEQYCGRLMERYFPDLSLGASANRRSRRRRVG